MTFGDLINKLYYHVRINVTAYGYYKSTEEYYSFRTIYSGVKVEDILAKGDTIKALLNTPIEAIDVHSDGTVDVDLYEYVDIEPKED